jgi:hypothetical protein
LLQSQKSRRCYQRVMSGLERGGQLRFLTLTSSPESSKEIEASWRALYMRLKRRGLIQGYIKVPELTQAGRAHLHVLFRGSYVSQKLISLWWSQIHHASIVDIRAVKAHGSKRNVAGYMAKYMSKEAAGRYSWSWGWVWKGFCKDWKLYKAYWSRWFEVRGVTTFKNCLLGWQMWLHGIYKISRADMEADYPPHITIQKNFSAFHVTKPIEILLGGTQSCMSQIYS